MLKLNSTRRAGGLMKPPRRGLEYPISNIEHMNFEVMLPSF